MKLHVEQTDSFSLIQVLHTEHFGKVSSFSIPSAVLSEVLHSGVFNLIVVSAFSAMVLQVVSCELHFLQLYIFPWSLCSLFIYISINLSHL